MLIVFTGDGKGKTSAALGIALRATGHNMNTLIIQFMKKKGTSGEQNLPEGLLKNIDILPFGGEFLLKGDDKEKHLKLAQEAWSKMKEMLSKKTYHILILDELTVAIKFELISLDTVMDFLKHISQKMHVIITGRYAPYELLNMADIATEMKKIKHIFDKGGGAVSGIDF
ncbi:MAG TPA: cob(I)yrinic acid a,c-diamide adenosyltransferase [Syntrophorhabdaceae bacterium]|nr:cob(I)yrinic acid a,c-diamide adenosyltransferase [Syntrophorhabdaceae bacterium]HPP05876.1 cob(I)yrinic acid a,c-diamide adenosyltransferase [Syntrophorhabdaceae bacterium]